MNQDTVGFTVLPNDLKGLIHCLISYQEYITDQEYTVEKIETQTDCNGRISVSFTVGNI